MNQRKEIQFDLFEGARRKDAGIKLVMEKNQNMEVAEKLEPIAKQISHSQGYCCSDDLRMYAATHGLTVTTPTAWGAICKFIFQADWIPIGYKRSVIPTTHAREIKKWKYMK